MKTQNMNTNSSYRCERHALNEEGETVKRTEERPVSVTLSVTEDKRVFWKGARVA